jgi:hypothetical protein
LKKSINEKLFPNALLRIKLITKNKTKNNEKARKKEKITVKFKKRIGCTKNIKINNFPSAPPIIFKVNSKSDKENTNTRIEIFKKLIIIINSENNKNSKKFTTIPKKKLNLKTFIGTSLNFKSK